MGQLCSDGKKSYGMTLSLSLIPYDLNQTLSLSSVSGYTGSTDIGKYSVSVLSSGFFTSDRYSHGHYNLLYISNRYTRSSWGGPKAASHKTEMT